MFLYISGSAFCNSGNGGGSSMRSIRNPAIYNYQINHELMVLVKLTFRDVAIKLFSCKE